MPRPSAVIHHKATVDSTGEMKQGVTALTGHISRLHFVSDTFAAGVLTDEHGAQHSFNAKCRVQLLELVTLHGSWEVHKKWGRQFAARLIEYPMPDVSSTHGLAEYLASNPAFLGIGPAKAQLIAQEFGESFDQVIREDPARVAATGKLTIEAAENIQKEWIARADVNAISTWLASYGLTHNQIKRIAEQYGNQARQILEENPYVLSDDLHGFGFARADEVALKMGTQKDHPGRIRACIVDLVKQEAEEGGHTYIGRRTLTKSAAEKLAFDSLDAKDLVSTQIDHLIETGDLVEAEHNGASLLAFPSIYFCEQDLIRWFRESWENPPSEHRTSTLLAAADIAIASSGRAPSESQRAAVDMALTNTLSVLSGGAGTGKSYTISLIHRIFHHCGLEVGLCAPTGKAAKRMANLAGAPASTIHKLLGYKPGRNGAEWGYGPDRKLEHSLIIVDEVSMCDIALLWRLFSAVDFSRTQVLLVGDHNQLSPIGAGNALRDILDHQLLPSHILVDCFRAAGQLKQNCNAILAGRARPTTPVLPTGGREWRLIDTLEEPADLIDALKLLMGGRLAQWGFDPIMECQIITPYNAGPLGVNRINAELQRVWQQTVYGLTLPEVPADQEPRLRFHTGDKIIQKKNDYKLDEANGGVMNGTMGVITSIFEKRTSEGKKDIYLVQFEDRERPVEIEQGSDQAANLALAYACTIHKVQGSEWPCVISVIHSKHSYMLSRNLFYTAVTRARKTAIILGNSLGIRRAIRTVSSSERRTWMALSGDYDNDDDQGNY